MSLSLFFVFQLMDLRMNLKWIKMMKRNICKMTAFPWMVKMQTIFSMMTRTQEIITAAKTLHSAMALTQTLGMPLRSAPPVINWWILKPHPPPVIRTR